MSSHFFENNNVYEENNELAQAISIEGAVWEEHSSQEQPEMSVCEVENNVLEDSPNETFLSVNEEGNSTEYFSVLEMTDDSVMSDLNLTAVHNVADDITFCQGVSGNEEVLEEPNLLIQPILYEIEGSNEYLAVQVTCDDKGNMQRLQYRMRQNENSEYEPVPDSTEILPLDECLNLNETQDDTIEQVEPEEEEEEEEEDEYDNEPQETKAVPHQPLAVDIKVENNLETIVSHVYNSREQNKSDSDIVTESTPVRTTWIKTEILEESSSDTNFSIHLADLDNGYVDVMGSIQCSNTQDTEPSQEQLFVNENEEETMSNDARQEETTIENNLNSEEDIVTAQKEIVHNFLESPDNLDDNGGVGEVEKDNGASSDGENCEETPKSYITNNTKSKLSEEKTNSSESDPDEYHIVDTNTEESSKTCDLEKTPVPKKSFNKPHIIKVLKSQQQSILVDKKLNGDIKTNNKNNQLYYVLKHPEKENVEVPYKSYKVNPRSILKTSFNQLEQQQQQQHQEQQQETQNKDKNNEDKTSTGPVEKIDKRFARNKEVIQAILFQNYIAKTTIPHAPVRHERLPRKQKIKPVERADEEIIVKEVAVSSRGFVEFPDENLLPKLSVEIVQLSDSDNEEREERRKSGRKNNKFSVSEIVISDTEDEKDDEKIVEIDLSVDSDENETNNQEKTKRPRGRPKKAVTAKYNDKEKSSENTIDNSNLKRKRGRPPKKKTSSDSHCFSPKKPRTDESDISDERTEIPCPKCSKSFPSKTSLKTHLQHHLLQEASSRRTLVFSLDKYKCSRCHEKFKNNALLTNHEKLHAQKGGVMECKVCHKVFIELSKLTAHKRSHAKEQMFLSTVSPEVSPKPCKSTKKVFKSPPLPPSLSKLKCPVCPKTFVEVEALNSHKRMFHQQFSCKSCSKVFYSKVTWESHVKNNCVKPKASSDKRLSLNVRKSFLVPSQRRVSMKGSRKSVNNKKRESNLMNVSNKPARTPMAAVKVTCEQCDSVYSSFKDLFQHKVLEHGLETPDKSVVENRTKKALFKDRVDQGGIPATSRIGNAWVGLKNKID